jgi:hypothetical protein
MDEYLGNGLTYRYQISNTDIGRSRRPLYQSEFPSSYPFLMKKADFRQLLLQISAHV